MDERYSAFNQFARHLQMLKFRSGTREWLNTHITNTREKLEKSWNDGVWQSFVDELFVVGCSINQPYLLRLSLMGKTCNLPSNANPFHAGSKPLLYACKEGHVDTVKWLCSDEFEQEIGAKFDLYRNSTDMVHMAGDHMHASILLWMLEQGVPHTINNHDILVYAVDFYEQSEDDPEENAKWSKVCHTLMEKYTKEELDQAMGIFKGDMIASAENAILDHAPKKLLDEWLSTYQATPDSSPHMLALAQKKVILEEVRAPPVSKPALKM